MKESKCTIHLGTTWNIDHGTLSLTQNALIEHTHCCAMNDEVAKTM